MKDFRLSFGLLGLAISLLFLSFLPTYAQEEDPQQQPVGLIGNDSILWIYSHTTDPAHNRTLLNFGLRVPGREFVGPAVMRGLVGKVYCQTLSNQDLHVFFSEGTHRRYRYLKSDHQQDILEHSEQPLPGNRLPIVVTTAGEYHLLAVVASDCAQNIMQEQNDRILANFNANYNHNGTVPGKAPLIKVNWDISKFALVEFFKGHWQVSNPIPDWFDQHSECKLYCSRDNILHLVFSEPSTNYLLYTKSELGTVEWNKPVQLPGSEALRPLNIFEVEERLVVPAWHQAQEVVCLVEDSSDPTNWRVEKKFLLNEKNDFSNYPHLSAARFEKLIALAMMNDQEQVNCGLWPVEGGMPAEIPAVVNVVHSSYQPKKESFSQTIIPFAVLALLLIFIFWKRQGSITRELKLPAQYVVASMWRRLAGFVMDAAPIGMLTFHYWYPPLILFMDEYQAIESEDIQSPLASAALLKGWLIFSGAFALYCTICEALFSTTPGKLGVQCRVVNESGHHCRFFQILVRNILRVIELYPMFQLWPTFILMLFTRNRQRLGDLLARTIVVERLQTARSRTSQPSQSNHDNKPGSPQE